MSDTDNERAQIQSLRAELGSRITIAAHHYQKAEIVSIADFTGDSYRLAVEASKSQADYIVFCGVRFMAESAAVLARPGQIVLIPDNQAGCPMADMIDANTASRFLQVLDGLCSSSVVPITYMNSYADMKALTGSRGGSVCTSSNAAKIVSRYLDTAPVFFSPDRNLGINTARAMGIDRDRIFTVHKDGSIVPDGRPDSDPSKALLFLWDGYCHVHKRFLVSDIAAMRSAHPGARVIVHPECDEDVVAASDQSGSTEAIWKAVSGGQPGSVWVVGTEASFVHRLAASCPDRTVLPLRESYCYNMARIDTHNVLASLRSIQQHLTDPSVPLLQPIAVDESVRSDAAASLKRMIDIVGGKA
ncbi:MAG TPA: quinolinate synthase NadA [Spirochaetales bacterium]|nr:quinolinate synthase NadA [Spirochaetales bacterium]